MVRRREGRRSGFAFCLALWTRAGRRTHTHTHTALTLTVDHALSPFPTFLTTFSSLPPLPPSCTHTQVSPLYYTALHTPRPAAAG
jgi:hypothetical protein